MFVLQLYRRFHSPPPAGGRTVAAMNPNFPDNFRGGRPFFDGRLDGHHGGPPALAWAIFAIELLLVAGVAVLLVRAFAFRPRPAGPASPPPTRRFRRRPDPLTHLRLRYANGDISREEYLEKTRDLGGVPEPDARTEELPPS
jgi:hypothetical protein